MTRSARAITVVLHDLPLGGGERIAIRLANRWAASDRKVTVLCGSRQGPLADMIDSSVEVVECEPHIPRGPGSRKALGEATAAFLSRRPSDILFVPGNYHWPVLPAVARLPRHVRPGVVAQIGTPLYRHGRGPLKQVAYNLRTWNQFQCVDSAVSLSASMTADMDRVLGRKITQCIRLPAAEDEAAPLTRAAGRMIVAAGRLVPEKGFDVALRAFARLKDPSATLAIIGEGPERKRLGDLAATLGVADRVMFPGYVPDIRPWLEKARAFLLSSYYEGYGAVIVEALAAGRPVVCTDCTPAAFELVGNGSAGAVAPIGDAAALADGLRRVLNAPAPAPAPLAARVAAYRIGAISQAYLQVFDEINTQRLASLERRPFNLGALWTFEPATPRPSPGSAPTYAGALHQLK